MNPLTLTQDYIEAERVRRRALIDHRDHDALTAHRREAAERDVSLHHMRAVKRAKALREVS